MVVVVARWLLKPGYQKKRPATDQPALPPLPFFPPHGDVSKSFFLFVMGHHLLEPFQVTILLEATDAPACNAWIAQHVYGVASADRHVGFDTESKPWFPPPPSEADHAAATQPSPPVARVALIQMAIGRAVLLYRVHNDPMCATWPRELVRMLQDEDVCKYCVDTRGDEAQLQSAGVAPQGLVDVQACAAKAEHGGTGTRESMKRLAQRLLADLVLEKSKSMSVSNWANVPLSLKQASYAACDAVVSLGLAEALRLAPATGLASMGEWVSALPPVDFSKSQASLVTTQVILLLAGGGNEAVDVLVQAPTVRRLLVTAKDVLAYAKQNKRLFVDEDERCICKAATPPIWLARRRQRFSVSTADLAARHVHERTQQLADRAIAAEHAREAQRHWMCWECVSGRIGWTSVCPGDPLVRPDTDDQGRPHIFCLRALRA
jgi:hypothetical protein